MQTSVRTSSTRFCLGCSNATCCSREWGRVPHCSTTSTVLQIFERMRKCGGGVDNGNVGRRDIVNERTGEVSVSDVAVEGRKSEQEVGRLVS